MKKFSHIKSYRIKFNQSKKTSSFLEHLTKE